MQNDEPEIEKTSVPATENDVPETENLELWETRIDYPITPNRLTTYVHWQQFWPFLLVFIAVFCACLLISKPLFPCLIVLAVFCIFYIISTRIASARVNSIKCARVGNTILFEQSYCGYYSKKAIELEQVTRISLLRSPLMRWCDVWGIGFDMATGQRSRIYGIRDAQTVHQELVKTRAIAFSKAHKK